MTHPSMGEGSVRKTNKKSEVLISSSLSGIAGLVVFGGALAVAGFIALSAFATNRNKAKANGKSALTKPEPKPQQLSLEDNIKSQDHDDHEIENTPNNDGDAVSPCHVTSDMSITQTLILEEKTDSPTCFHHHQEIVLSDNSHPESGASSSNENGIEEERLVSMFHNSGSQAQEDESLKSIQTETKDDDDYDDDDDDDDDVVLESGEEEESSNAIEETTLNSKEEEVLAGELIDEVAEQDFKGEEGTAESDIQSQDQEAQGPHKTDISASAEASDCAGTNVAVTPDATFSEKSNCFVGLNHQPSPSHSFQLITWLMPMLFLASLLLLVLITQQFFYVLDQGN